MRWIVVARARSLVLGAGLVFGPWPLAGQACAPGASADSVAVLRVATGIIDADNHRDLDRVLASYAPDAVLHPPGEGPVTGHAAIRPRYVALFSSYDPRIESDVRTLEVCGTLAVVTGTNRGVLRGRGGAQDRALSDAFVMVLARRDGEWRITRLMWHRDRP